MANKSISAIADKPDLFLVAHRGDRAGGVENTLSAFAYAAAGGARFGECDIQFSRDLMAVVIHDDRLQRLCNRPDMLVHENDLSTLEHVCSHHFPLLTLTVLLAWLQTQAQFTMFIEIKPAIRNRLSDRKIAEYLADVIPTALRHQIVLISQSGQIIDACKSHLECRTGWVAEGDQRPALPVDYVFMPQQDIAAMAAWQADGVLVGLYTVNTADQACHLLSLGADLIETNHFVSMAQSMKDCG